MADPEIRSDEKVLVRTQGVYVKSIPFEGILTNRRIILIDRAKNLLPPTEIPLITIKEFEPGENAIRDQIILLSVVAKTGETRQMILTFSRQAGGNRIKERDEWMRLLKENASFSPDPVIRKVIPGPEPAHRRAEPAAGQRYEIVRSPVRPAAPPDENRPVVTAMDSKSPVRSAGVIAPVNSAPPSPAVRQSDQFPIGTNVFCPKCGNKVPAESVFCNRCGSPISQTPPVSPSLQTPAAPPVVKMPATRPIDEEIQSIEPLIKRSTVKIPTDPLRTVPGEPPVKQPLSWDDDKEPEPVSLQEAQIHSEKPPGERFLPGISPAKPPDAAKPAPVTSYEGTGDTPPPPKPPHGRSFIPRKQTILTTAIVLILILIVAAIALFVYPMLTSGGLTMPSGPGDGGHTVTPTSSKVLTSGTIVIKATQAPAIPKTGVYVHVNYLGGFKGSYGIPDTITDVPGNSGDRFWEVENATNSTVQATFEKLDGSSHELLVEIYKDGKILTVGTTTVGHGSVTLSVDIATGIAAAPVTSGGGSTVKTTMAAITTSAG